MTGRAAFLTMRTARLTATSFLGKYLSRIFSASSFEMEFEGTLTSTPSRRTSSIRRLVSIFRSLARSYMRTLEVTADMRSLLLAKSVASTPPFARRLKERCYVRCRRRGVRFKPRTQQIFGRLRSISSLLVLCAFVRRGHIVGRRSEGLFI